MTLIKKWLLIFRMRVFRYIACLLLIIPLVSGCGRDGLSSNTSFIYPPLASHWGFARLGVFDLRLLLGNKTRFDNPQGITIFTPKGGSPVSFWVNSGQNVIVYNRSRFSLNSHGLRTPHSLQIYGKNLTGEGRLRIPWGIAVDGVGNVYVVDRGNSRLVKFRYSTETTTAGELLFEGQIGGEGSEPGQFLDPRGVSVAGEGLIAVVDNSLDRVTIMNDKGEVLNYWDGLDEPVSIAASYQAGSKLPDSGKSPDFLIVIDSLDRRVTKCDYNGNVLARVDAMKWNAPLTPELNFVAIDGHQQTYITDRNNGCIHKLDKDLNYLTRFGESGTGDYQFDQPRGIAIDPQSGQMFVVEREQLQRLLVAVDVPLFTADVSTDSVLRNLLIDFKITEPAYVDFDLVDDHGQFVARILQDMRYSAGLHHVSWGLVIPTELPDGRPSPTLPPPYKPGEKLPNGEYRIKATFTATYESKNPFANEKVTDFVLKW